ncbi:MAG: hypothetical protein CMK32_07945 [Porticoccaceae bacterium]|nr:hypothetical protein [Porticoccaceae bacterium]
MKGMRNKDGSSELLPKFKTMPVALPQDIGEALEKAQADICKTIRSTVVEVLRDGGFSEKARE